MIGPDKTVPTKYVTEVLGYFDGFLRDKGFEFVAFDMQKKYAGPIAAPLRRRVPENFEMVLGRESGKRYLARIEVRRTDDKETYRLIDYVEVDNHS
jgi:hypothetical protein